MAGNTSEGRNERLLAVFLPFVGASPLIGTGKELGERELARTDFFWVLAAGVLLAAGLFYVVEAGLRWLLAGAGLLAAQILLMRLLPVTEEEFEPTDTVRDDDHVIPEHAADERARRGVPPM